MKLQSLFLPDVFKSYYLFKNRYIGIHTTPSFVYVTVVEAHKYTRSITSSSSYSLTSNPEEPEIAPAEKLVATLKKIKKELGLYDNLTITIPATHVVFKELTLPFVSREKIALVLPFEIEPYLPFASADAVIDFMITSVNSAEKKSTIMVAAVPKTVLTELLEPYTQADFYPTQIAVDMLALVSFVNQITPDYDARAVVAFDELTTGIAYCPGTTLKALRALDTTPSDELIKKIVFSLNGFQDAYGPIEHIVVTGTQADLYKENLKKQTGVSVTELVMDTKDRHNSKIVLEQACEQYESFSAAAAFPTQENIDFNLLPLEIAQQQLGRTFSKQLIAAGLLSILLLGGLITHTVLSIKKLSTTAQTIKTETLKELKKRFPTIKTTNIATALKNAQKEVTLQQELWSAFSGSTSHYLFYLATISTAVDRDSLGLTLNKMVINKKTITLEGKVQSFEALEALEKRLKASNLFVSVPDLQKTDFSLVLTLKNQGDGA